ncbi:hypothetical protein Fluta_1102 [Fluviicola taffensis DSM 16823]|uniref:Uncharacterized protein n=1 Tax=Fluviicola taffensis (strain DSM 16823 / NCIMB 13979 / RW262) TaxID=755732 RepID=F2IAG3_FLUTR|nr:hypothetical protein Fluta_1102 [Fluviicola taffensis DSM 16823]
MSGDAGKISVRMKNDWTPAKIKGQVVRCYYALLIEFKR